MPAPLRIVLAVFVATCLWPTPALSADNVGASIGVRELMENAERYTGPVAVDGVVSQTFPDRGVLALIDVEEFRRCEVLTCAKLTLPVRWEGPMPSIASAVRAHGEVKKEGVRRVFVADALNPLD